MSSLGSTNAADIAERVAELVKIPSVNPLMAGPKAGVAGEQGVANWLANRAEAAGADVTVDPVIDGRSNVYARFAGETDRSITVDVHMDTVGVEHMTRDPFDGVVEDGLLYGRGAADTKASLAIVLTVLEELAADGRRPVPTINLVGTVSEEVGGLLGAARYSDWLKANNQSVDQLIVAEPTMCSPVHGHKGGVGLVMTVKGHAAHSSKPHLGQNAVSAAARIVVAIDEEHDRLMATPASTSVGGGTVSVNEIEGGLARNIIPDCCTLYAGRRLAPGEDPQKVFDELSALARRAAAPLEVEITMPYGHGFPAFYEDAKAPLIELLCALGDGVPETATYGSNALLYRGVASQTAVFGPGSIDQAHQAVEWISVDEIGKATDIYRQLLTRHS